MSQETGLESSQQAWDVCLFGDQRIFDGKNPWPMARGFFLSVLSLPERIIYSAHIHHVHINLFGRNQS